MAKLIRSHRIFTHDDLMKPFDWNHHSLTCFIQMWSWIVHALTCFILMGLVIRRTTYSTCHIMLKNEQKTLCLNKKKCETWVARILCDDYRRTTHLLPLEQPFVVNTKTNNDKQRFENKQNKNVLQTTKVTKLCY